jgi:hypothetical protein
MHEQRSRRRVSIFRRGVSVRNCRQAQQHEFPKTLDRLNPPPRKVLFQRHGIIDEIRFPQPYGQNGPTQDRLAQSADDGLDFGKFRHDFFPDQNNTMPLEPGHLLREQTEPANLYASHSW